MDSRKRSAGLLLAGACLAVSLAATAADPVAFISDIKGEVVMNGAGRPPFLAEVIPGTKLALGTGASAAVMYVVSGKEYALKGPGQFVVTREGVKTTAGVEPTSRVPGMRASPKVLVETSRASTASLRMRSASLPKGERPGPLYPVNVRIATLQPTLRWSGDPGAAYTVTVTAADGREVHRGNASGLSLRLPARLLGAGQSYAWRYSAGEAMQGDFRFETLPAEAIAEADKARAAAKTFADRVLLALILQDLGATQDSREVWAQLSAERPDLPELAGLSR